MPAQSRKPASAATPAPKTTEAAGPACTPKDPSGGMGNAALAEELKKAPMAPEETSFLHETGEALGLGAGVAVTEVLALLPSWREPVLDKDGKPAASVPGADRIGEHEIQKRHQQVVGPQIAKFAQKLPPGMLKDFVAGFGLGATEGPGASYRLEAGIADMF